VVCGASTVGGGAESVYRTVSDNLLCDEGEVGLMTWIVGNVGTEEVEIRMDGEEVNKLLKMM